MMEAARQVLTAAGVPATGIWEERFASLHDAAGTQARPPARSRCSFRCAAWAPGGEPAQTVEAVVQPGQSLLEAGLSAGVELPFSCAMGGCGACKGQAAVGPSACPSRTV